MSETTERNDGGLGAPARGRPRKQSSISGTPNGVEKSEGGKPESESRIESAPRADAGAGAGAFPVINPLDLPIGDGSSSGTKRRGRPRGTGKKEETVQNLSSLLKIEKILISGAFFLGNIANTPELQMSEEQAKDIREAIEELCRLYPIGMSEKKIAWINFSFAVGGWAGPGIMAFARRPPKPRPQLVPHAIRETQAAPNAPQAQPEVIQGLPIVGPGAKGPDAAKTPSEMWMQPGDIQEPEDVVGGD